MFGHDMDDLELLVAPRATSTLPGNVVRGGSRNGLSFEIEWEDGPRSTHACLRLRVGGVIVWGDADDGVRVDMLRLLEFLATRWDDISLDESYPLGVTPAWPSELERTLKSVCEEKKLPRESYKQYLRAFSSRHDLGSWDSQKAVSQLWVLREGNLMVIDAFNSRQLRWPYRDVILTLTTLGDAIVKRACFSKWPRQDLIAKWEQKDSAPSISNFGLRLGIPVESVNYLLERNVVPFPASRAELIRGLDEVKMAARMLNSFVKVKDIASILRKLELINKRPTDHLDDLSAEAATFLTKMSDSPPHEQGRSLALWFRGCIGKSQIGDVVEPDSMLRSWNVDIQELSIGREIEAISVWGPNHGPCVLLNKQGSHSRSPIGRNIFDGGGARATLAHEICHLLVDRGRSLPVAEVFGGMTPRIPEQRANAFAAEFLVPREWAIAQYRNSSTVMEAVDIITLDYRVTKTLAATQLLTYNREHPGYLPEDDRISLESLAFSR